MGGWPVPQVVRGGPPGAGGRADCTLAVRGELWLSGHVLGLLTVVMQTQSLDLGPLSVQACTEPDGQHPVYSIIAGSPSRLSVGEQPEVTHDPYEFLQSPEPAASAKS